MHCDDICGRSKVEATKHCFVPRGRHGVARYVGAISYGRHRTEPSLSNTEYGTAGQKRHEIHAGVRVQRLLSDASQSNDGPERGAAPSDKLDVEKERQQRSSSPDTQFPEMERERAVSRTWNRTNRACEGTAGIPA